jgi:hypothetical protein
VNVRSGSIQELTDREEIRELIYRCAHYADTRDPRFLELLTDDIYFDLGPGAGGPVSGKQQLTKRRRTPATHFQGRVVVRSSHHTPNVLIESLNAETAELITSVCAWHLFEDGTESTIWGYYEDQVARQGDSWRLARRVLYVYGDMAAGNGWNPGSRAQ